MIMKFLILDNSLTMIELIDWTDLIVLQRINFGKYCYIEDNIIL